MPKAKDILKNYPFSWPQLQSIFFYLFSQDILKLYLENSEIGAEKIKKLNHIALLYSQGLPLAYILQKTCFYGLDLKVNPKVLIPRPETEILAESAIEYINSLSTSWVRVLDLGTGSGNISLALAKNARRNVSITALDISFSALEVAKENICAYGFDNIFLLQADMFSSFQENVFDVIVANPPYVEDDYCKDNPNLKYEPQTALRAKDGFFFSRKILQSAHKFLKAGGRLFLEIGYNQSGRIKRMLAQSSRLKLCTIISDYGQKERVVVAEKA